MVGRTIKGVLGFWCCLLVGCSSQPAVVTGSVTYNGQPVESGSISFQPDGGQGAGFGAVIVNGKYKAEKIFPGKKVALVRGVNKDVTPHSREEYERRAAEAKTTGRNQPMAGPAEYIPEDAKGNKQSVDVSGGAQTFDFQLTGPPRPQ